MTKATLYYNGQILTMDSSCPHPEAVAVVNGRIAGVGDVKTMKNIVGEGGRFVDLEGKTMMPGFIDGHSHFPSGGMNRMYSADLAVDSVAEAVERLKAQTVRPRPSEWVVGFNYDEQCVCERRFLTLAELDEACPDKPLFFRHVSGHTGMANSIALAMAGITRDTPDPVGGAIGRDEHGNPNGLLSGIPAQSLVRRLIPQYTMEELKAALVEESCTYASYGITTAHGGPAFSPMDMELGYKVTEILVQCAKDGSLPLRTVILIRASDISQLSPYATPVPGTDLSGNHKVTLGGVKFVSDGDPRDRTGFFSAPYPALPGETEPYYGKETWSAEKLTAAILPMHKAGWQIAVHANGDAAIDNVLDAFAAVQRVCPRPDARHLVIHAQYIRKDQLLRMRSLGAYPCFFISPLWFWDHIHAQNVGDERVEDFCPCGDAERMGIPFNLHSDCPITPVTPLLQVQTAVTRVSKEGVLRGRHQAASLYAALRAITIDAAFMNFEEGIKGSITPGKFADFTLLDKNPLQVSPDTIKDIQVMQTIVDDESVFTR
ncbi:amidohydrolase [uncultured Mailhella sp.]|uniref:amidohydrolase n=1 Tax=uncultured Mailhella sp. TaxID=1981031 RepID=UPI002629A2F5|nr:amidohydrolase [uncultured Mailhella sp.]